MLQEYSVNLQEACLIDSAATPSLKDIKKMSNKQLLWCGMVLVSWLSPVGCLGDDNCAHVSYFQNHWIFTCDYTTLEENSRDNHIEIHTGTRTCNLLACMKVGMPPASIEAPASGYMVSNINMDMASIFQHVSDDFVFLLSP